MSITVRAVLDAAYGRSRLTREGVDATEDPELLNLVQRIARQVISGAAPLAPEHLGTSAAVAFASGGWVRPATAEVVYRIETPAGARVAVVPTDDRTADTATPSVYRLGGTYRSAGNAGDPASGNLTLYYVPQAETLAGLEDAVDARIPDQFADLLILPVAIYLATKANANGVRSAEIDQLKGELQAESTRWAAFLANETLGITSQTSTLA